MYSKFFAHMLTTPRDSITTQRRATATLRRGWLALALMLWGATVFAAEPHVVAVESIGISVRDLERAKAFYSQILDFQLESEREVLGSDYEHLFGVFGLRLRVARMRLGDERIELMQFLTPRGRPVPVDSRSNDHWFQHIAIVVSDMAKAYTHLRANRVEHASTGPQRLPDWNPNAGGIEAFYFRDPDGNHLEVIHFPPGKGAEKWRDPRGKLFQGIDHTAIVVADTEASLRYYRDLLGLKVAGGAENYGTEQEHLNNVFGARLRITALKAPQGPGVEFLEYLAPRTGRAMPSDSTPLDHWYWQINFRAQDLAAADRALRDARVIVLSGAAVTLEDSAPGYRQALIARDPDGHAGLLASGESP
jgi:catechol 2,3-dioxygenase-like lactoylglutathione lyase family enzyme